MRTLLSLPIFCAWALSSLFSSEHSGLTSPDQPLRFSDVPTKRAAPKKVVFVAGSCSHGAGQHEHKAGCILLAKRLRENVPGMETEVFTDGWPTNPKAFDGAAAVVIYGDGGEGHMINKHLESVNALMKKGVGLACIHYAVEVPKGTPGTYFLDWIGGYFETFWSVNPVWTAAYKALPSHVITQGVIPFTLNDEWYYHMRFRPDMNGVTPILTTLPPVSTLDRKDGPHEGNAAVRAEIGAGTPQHMAWCRERPDGGRGFGITGGHFHRVWADDNMRKLVLNAITWIAKADIPNGGVSSSTPTKEEMGENQCPH